ncbi:MAG: flippase [Gracilimonas sp.]|uniref:flippase n=1 Tax=Gracilimonas sp. TaxID=1974203 RepID=UPI0019A0AD1A|nr:flippase [Gracilimonas sp.]MBD3615430.1 flippase [Gracilimonas sp.]
MDKGIGTSVAKNTTVMLGAQLLTWVSSFVLLMFLPRYLGSADYGRLYLAMSIAMILGIIIDFGGNYLIPKEVAKEKKSTPNIMVSYIGVRSILWVFCMAILLLFSWFVEYSATVLILIGILGFSKLWEGVIKAIKSCFQGHEMMEYPSIGQIAQKVFVAAIAVSALIFGAGPITIAIIMVMGAVLNLVICLKFVPIIVDNLPKFNFDISLNLVRNSIPYFLWSIFAVIYYRVDAVMLSTLSTEQVVGWYGGAYRFFDIVMFLPSIFTTVIFPVFSRLSAEGDEQLTDTFQRSLRYMVLTAVPMTILFLFFSEDIIHLFYGLDEYEPSIIILQIFAPGIVLVYIDFILGSYILATDKQRVWAIIGFTAILLNVGLNYGMIPYADQLWGNAGIGAAISTLLTELFILIGAFVLLPGKYFSGLKISLPFKAIAGGIAMATMIYLLKSMMVFWPILAALGLFVYASFAVGSGMITKAELQFGKEFFSRQNLRSFLKAKGEQI